MTKKLKIFYYVLFGSMYIMQAIHNVNKNTHIKWDNVKSRERIDDMKKKKKLRFGYNTRINSK